MSYCWAIWKPEVTISIEITLTVNDSLVNTEEQTQAAVLWAKVTKIQIRVIASLVDGTSF